MAKKICPLLLVARSARSSEQMRSCIEEKCAWFFKEDGAQHGFFALYQIAAKLTSINLRIAEGALGG